ncbi:rRNA-processing protein FCF1 [Lachnellula suecica]|uniref:rRNA-processing protein FCF1 n=1 Tax=Lachnellula suecica TaxID=602035 RepID=A0A8T9CKH7_9HELO|nr:rRNA-processing protein FCF1 [Lachnellula suecica]
MGTAKKTRKFGAVKRMIGSNHAALKKNQNKGEEGSKKKQEKSSEVVREVPQVSSALFFQYNTAYAAIMPVQRSRNADWK